MKPDNMSERQRQQNLWLYTLTTEKRRWGNQGLQITKMVLRGNPFPSAPSSGSRVLTDECVRVDTS